MTVQELVEKYEEYLKVDNYDKIFEDKYLQDNDEDRQKLIKFLYFDCGIDVLSHMTKIPEGFFKKMDITSIKIPSTIKEISIYAFYGCDSLISIKLSDSVTKIGKLAFAGCESLQSISIPDSVTEIGKHAFAYCGSLPSIIIPDSVTKIGDWAFAWCDSLQSISIPKHLDVSKANIPDTCEIIRRK